MNELKLCSGYLDRPEHMTDEFHEDDSYCRPCRKESNDKHNPRNNAVISLTEKYIPQRVRRKHPLRKEMHAFAVEVFKGNESERELQKIIRGCLIGYLDGTYMDTDPVDDEEVLQYLRSEPKPPRIVTTTVKPRNSSLVTYLKEKYNYTCQVRGCSEQEVDVAHLHPHRYKDSVDDETNAAVLCKNHHWSLDWKRMYIEDDLSFTRYNLDGKIIEESAIVCHEDHNIDAKFITKSQDWFLGGADDRKTQEMD